MQMLPIFVFVEDPLSGSATLDDDLFGNKDATVSDLLMLQIRTSSSN